MIDEFDKNSTEISTTASYVVNPEDIFKVMIRLSSRSTCAMVWSESENYTEAYQDRAN